MGMGTYSSACKMGIKWVGVARKSTRGDIFLPPYGLPICSGSSKEQKFHFDFSYSHSTLKQYKLNFHNYFNYFHYLSIIIFTFLYTFNTMYYQFCLFFTLT